MGFFKSAANAVGDVFNLPQAVFDFGMSWYNNKQNRKLARESNDFNALMWQKEADYNTEMWEKSNHYNSPQEQVARLRQAGINPAMALGNVQPGSASMQSSPSHNPAVTPDFQPFASPLDRILEVAQVQAAVDTAQANNEKTRAESSLLKSQIPYASMTAEEMFNDLKWRNRHNKQNWDLNDWNLSFLESTFNDRVASNHLDALGRQYQTDLLGLAKGEAEFNNALAKYRLDHLPQYAQYDLMQQYLDTKQRMAEIAERSSNIRVAKAQIGKLKEETKQVFWSTGVLSHGASLPDKPYLKKYKAKLNSFWDSELDKLESETFSNYTSGFDKGWNLFSLGDGKSKGKSRSRSFGGKRFVRFPHGVMQ